MIDSGNEGKKDRKLILEQTLISKNPNAPKNVKWQISIRGRSMGSIIPKSQEGRDRTAIWPGKFKLGSIMSNNNNTKWAGQKEMRYIFDILFT